jgi:hypothetical protein
LDLNANAPAAGNGSFLFNFIPAWMRDMNMKSGRGADEQPEI